MVIQIDKNPKIIQSKKDDEDNTPTMDYFTMLATRRPTPMQSVFKRVPYLPYSVPRNGLPAWRDLPLDRCLPYIRVPASTICFTKGKMGANLYPQPPGAPFNPCPSPAPEYDAEFDPHLKNWWARQTLKHEPPCRPLERPCTMAQFNTHRQLLHRVWSKLAFIELRKQDDDDRDAYKMRKIGEIRDRQRYNALKAKIRSEQMQKVLERKEEELRLKHEDMLLRDRIMEMRIQKCKDLKAERQRERIRKAKEKKEMLRQKSEAGKEIARMKLIKTLKTMRITDNKVRRQLQANNDNRLKKMMEEDARKWAVLWKSQIERNKLKNDTMRIYTENLRKVVKTDLKTKRHAKNWKDELLRSMQLANLKQFSDIEKKYVRGMKKQLIKRWKAKLPHEYYTLMRIPEPSPPDDILTEAVHCGINGRSSSMTSLDRADYWLNKLERVPKQVRAAINTVLGKVIVIVTTPHAVKVMDEVRKRCIKIVERKIYQLNNPIPAADSGPNRVLKCIPRSPSQQELHHDLKEERNAPDEVARSLAALRRVMTQIIRDHVYKSYDPVLKECISLPRTVEREGDMRRIAGKLAVYVCHTRSKDVLNTAILVRKTSEDMLREVIRKMKEDKGSND